MLHTTLYILHFQVLPLISHTKFSWFLIISKMIHHNAFVAILPTTLFEPCLICFTNETANINCGKLGTCTVGALEDCIT